MARNDAGNEPLGGPMGPRIDAIMIDDHGVWEPGNDRPGRSEEIEVLAALAAARTATARRPAALVRAGEDSAR